MATSNGQADYTVQALRHRLVAIKLVNERLSEPGDVDGGDALFASCVCLISQSSLMPDGLLDLLMLYRGLAVLGQVVIRDQEHSRFGSRFARAQAHQQSQSNNDSPKNGDMVDNIKEEGRNSPTMNGNPNLEEQIREAQRIHELAKSLAVLEPFCTGVAEKQVFDGLWSMTHALQEGHPVDTWAPMAAVKQPLCTVSSPHFAAFVDGGNYASQLLVAHAFLVDWFLRYEKMDPSEQARQIAWQRVILARIVRVLEGLPEVFGPAAVWPRRYCAALVAGGFQMGLGFGSSIATGTTHDAMGDSGGYGQQQQQQQMEVAPTNGNSNGVATTEAGHRMRPPGNAGGMYNTQQEEHMMQQ